MRRWQSLPALLCGVLLSAPAPACDLSEPERATVASVEDGETLKLTDGRVVRLIGAKAPSAPLSWRGEAPWPLVEEAHAALSRLAAGAEIELRFGGNQIDRHGRLLVHVFALREGQRVWVQAALVAQGLARVYSLPGNTACARDLLAREAEARAKRLGVWRSWAYRILRADDLERLGRLGHTYQLVEGTVHAVGEGAGQVYVNFAQDWRRDFTISVARKDVPDFAAAGIDLSGLAGKRVRVRGWIGWRNGPMIEASHPEQIELLPDLPGL